MTRMPAALWARLAIGVLALQASIHPRRRQGIGVAAALGHLGSGETGDARREFFQRHGENFNTNPAMAGPLLGAVARLELEAASGDAHAAAAAVKLKRALESPFAAVGDAILWKGLRGGGGAWFSTVAWIWGPVGPAAFLATYNLVHLGMRLGGIHWGYAEGRNVHRLLKLPVVGRLRRVGVVMAGSAGAAGLLSAVALPAETTAAPAMGAAAAAIAFFFNRGGGRGTGIALGAILLGLAASTLGV